MRICEYYPTASEVVLETPEEAIYHLRRIGGGMLTASSANSSHTWLAGYGALLTSSAFSPVFEGPNLTDFASILHDELGAEITIEEMKQQHGITLPNIGRSLIDSLNECSGGLSGVVLLGWNKGTPRVARADPSPIRKRICDLGTALALSGRY